jgi:nucleobase:cation symporter-1, NCS1 family
VPKVLRVLAVPFAVLFVIMAVITLPKAHLTAGHGAGWGAMTVFLALVIAGGGLGWTENANDYSRYLAPGTSPRRIVAAVALGAAIPSALLEILGAAVATGVPGATSVTGLTAGFPDWFIVPYLAVAIIQLFAINTLDLYSSGVTLQSLVPGLSRLQCVTIDTVVAGGLTAAAVFSSRFFALLSDFVLFIIVWLGPWCAIYLTDWLLRRGRYDPAGLLDIRGGRYFRRGGVHWPAIIAQAAGMAAAALWLNAATPYVSVLSRSAGLSDFSVFTGFAVAGIVYWLLARRAVRAEGAATEPPDGR